MMKRFVFALLAAILLCLMLMFFADITNKRIESRVNGQQQLQTWDAEMHANMTADATSRK